MKYNGYIFGTKATREIDVLCNELSHRYGCDFILGSVFLDDKNIINGLVDVGYDFIESKYEINGVYVRDYHSKPLNTKKIFVFWT